MATSMGPNFQGHPAGMGHPGVSGHPMAPGMNANGGQPGTPGGGMPHQFAGGPMGAGNPGGMNPAMMSAMQHAGNPNMQGQFQQLTPAQQQMLQQQQQLQSQFTPSAVAAMRQQQVFAQQQRQAIMAQQAMQNGGMAPQNMGANGMAANGLPMNMQLSQQQIAQLRAAGRLNPMQHPQAHAALVAQQMAMQHHMQNQMPQGGPNAAQMQMNSQMLQNLQQAQAQQQGGPNGHGQMGGQPHGQPGQQQGQQGQQGGQQGQQPGQQGQQPQGQGQPGQAQAQAQAQAQQAAAHQAAGQAQQRQQTPAQGSQAGTPAPTGQQTPQQTPAPGPNTAAQTPQSQPQQNASQPQQAQPQQGGQQQGQQQPQQPQNAMQMQQQQMAAHQMNTIFQHQRREQLKTQCLVKLSQLSEHLSGNPGAGSRDDLSYWNSLVGRFFSTSATFRHTLPSAEGDDSVGRQYDISFPAIARYFHTHFGSGVKSMQLTLGQGTADRALPGDGYLIENPKANLIYWFETGSHLVSSGSLRVQFDNEQKMELFEFLATSHEEFIARKQVIDAAKPAHVWMKEWHKVNSTDSKQSPEMSKKGKGKQLKSPQREPPEVLNDLPDSAVNRQGVTEAVYQFLEIVEVMGQMNPLFNFTHNNPGLGPYAALDQYVSTYINAAPGQMNGQVPQGAPRTPSFSQFPIGASPAATNMNLPGSPHVGSPAPGQIQAPGMQLQQSQQGTSSSGPSANTSPASNKRRRPSAVKIEEDGSGAGTPGSQVNGAGNRGKPATPRMPKRVKANPS